MLLYNWIFNFMYFFFYTWRINNSIPFNAIHNGSLFRGTALLLLIHRDPLTMEPFCWCWWIVHLGTAVLTFTWNGVISNTTQRDDPHQKYNCDHVIWISLISFIVLIVWRFAWFLAKTSRVFSKRRDPTGSFQSQHSH